MRRVVAIAAVGAAFTIGSIGVAGAAPENSSRSYQLPLDCGTEGQFVATVLANGAVVAWVEGDRFVAKSFDPDVDVTVTVAGETVSFHDDEVRQQGSQGTANNRDLFTCTFVVDDLWAGPLSRRDARQLGFDESLIGETAEWDAQGTVDVLAFQAGN